MSELFQPLHNSTRYINQLTYTPVEISKSAGDKSLFTNRALQKFSFVSSLGITPEEFEWLKTDLKNVGGADSDLASVVSELSELALSQNLESGAIKAVGKLDAELLLQVGEKVYDRRKQRFEEAVVDAKAILEDYKTLVVNSSSSLELGQSSGTDEEVENIDSDTIPIANIPNVIPESSEIKTLSPGLPALSA